MLPENIDLRSQLDRINSFLATVYKDIYRVSVLLHKLNAKESVIIALRQAHLRAYLLALTQRWQVVIRNELPERHAEIIIRRYALHNQAPPTLETLGVEYGISRERIRQIQEKGLRRLRSPQRRQLLQDAAIEAICEVTSLPRSELIDAAQVSSVTVTNRGVSPVEEDAERVAVAATYEQSTEDTGRNVETKPTDHMKTVRQHYARAYERWSAEEDSHLQDLYRNGVDIADIAAILERQPSAVRARLTRLGLLPPSY